MQRKRNNKAYREALAAHFIDSYHQNVHLNNTSTCQTQHSPADTLDTAALSTKLSSYDSWNGEMMGPGFSSDVSLCDDYSEGEQDYEFQDIKNYLVKMCNELLAD